MANICLLTDYTNTAHNAATSCRDAMVAGGHTVTIVGDDVVSSHDYSAYDLVATSRTRNAIRTAVATKLNELNNAGKPLIIGTVEGGVSAGGDKEIHSTLMGITGNIWLDSSETELNVIDNQHAITQGSVLGTNILFSTGNYLGGATSFIGTNLARGRGLYTQDVPVLIAMEAGLTRLTTGTLGARIVLFPTYLISGAYTTLHQTLLNQAVYWALAGEGAYEPPPPPEQVEASKLVGYAVMNYPEGHAASSKLTAYAVMDIEHAQVYSSKLVAYAVMDGEYTPPEPIEPRVGDTLGHHGSSWENNPTSFLNQWQRNQVDISGATNPTYLLVPADEGTMIRNRLIGVNEFGQSDPVFSAEVGPILPAEAVEAVARPYWRILRQDSVNASFVGLAELSFDAAAATGGEPVFSSEDPSFPAVNAFDADTATQWRTVQSEVAGAYLGYHFPTDVLVNAVTMTGMPTSVRQSYPPTAFAVQSSTDGVNWLTEWEVVTEQWGISEVRTFTRP